MRVTNIKSHSGSSTSNVGALFILMLFLCAFFSPFSVQIRSVAAQTGETTLNFYVTCKFDFGGPGYNVFSPQTLVIQEGNQVNLTIRNTGNETLHLQVEGQPTVTIQSGSQNNTGVTPVDTVVPIFKPSNAGIYNFQTVEYPEMNGQIVVLPTDWAMYKPNTQVRSFTKLVLADFAGVGYDKFFSGIMVVNQGDTVNVSIRNTDDMPHGFAIASYGVNEAVNPGEDLSDGSIAPVTTLIPSFIASNPGIFRFLCTTYCGPGHFDMVGSLVVLPTGGTNYSPSPITSYNYLTIKPDFAGEGYDKYIPDTIFVNQNDLVYIKIRNTDIGTHGFELPNFFINKTVAVAQNTTTGVAPDDTYVSAFFANPPGIYEFFCNDFCGPGHDQMIGYLVILPSLSTTSTPAPTQASSGGVSPIIFLLVIAALIVGILIGIVTIAKFKKTDIEATMQSDTKNS